MLIGILIGLVCGFVAGALVFRNNQKLGNKVIEDVQNKIK